MDFEQACQSAGLAWIRCGSYDQTTYIVWKPGKNNGWIVRPSLVACYCSDCFSLYTSKTDRLIASQIRNIGLNSVAIGELTQFRFDLERVECEFREFGVEVMPLEESEVYSQYCLARE